MRIPTIVAVSTAIPSFLVQALALDPITLFSQIEPSCVTPEYQACKEMASEQIAACASNDVTCQCHQIVGLRDICSQACATPMGLDIDLKAAIESTCGVPSEITSSFLGLKQFFPFIESGFYYGDDEDDDDDYDDCDNGDDSDDGSRWHTTSIVGKGAAEPTNSIPAPPVPALASDEYQDSEYTKNGELEMSGDMDEDDEDYDDSDGDVDMFKVHALVDGPVMKKELVDDDETVAASPDSDDCDGDSIPDSDPYNSYPYPAPHPPRAHPGYPAPVPGYPAPLPAYPPPNYYYPPAPDSPGAPAPYPDPEDNDAIDDCDGPDDDDRSPADRHPFRDRYGRPFQRLVRGSDVGTDMSGTPADIDSPAPGPSTETDESRVDAAAVAFPKFKFPWFKSNKGDNSENVPSSVPSSAPSSVLSVAPSPEPTNSYAVPEPEPEPETEPEQELPAVPEPELPVTPTNLPESSEESTEAAMPKSVSQAVESVGPSTTLAYSNIPSPEPSEPVKSKEENGLRDRLRMPDFGLRDRKDEKEESSEEVEDATPVTDPPAGNNGEESKEDSTDVVSEPNEKPPLNATVSYKGKLHQKNSKVGIAAVKNAATNRTDSNSTYSGSLEQNTTSSAATFDFQTIVGLTVAGMVTFGMALYL